LPNFGRDRGETHRGILLLQRHSQDETSFFVNGSQVMFLTALFYRYPIRAFERLRPIFVIINTINTI